MAKGDSRAPRPFGLKPSRAEFQRRLDAVEALLRLGKSRHQIAREVGISARTAERYMKIVWELWRVTADLERPHRLDAQRARVLSAIERATADRAWSAVAKLEALLAALDGNLPDVRLKVDVTAGRADPLEGLTPEQLRRVAATGLLPGEPGFDLPPTSS